MWNWGNNTAFEILEVIPELDGLLQPVPGASEFNYFFTLVSIFGLIGVAVATLVKLITRS